MNRRVSLTAPRGRAGPRPRRRFLNSIVLGKLGGRPAGKRSRREHHRLPSLRAAHPARAALLPAWQPVGVRVLNALMDARAFSALLLVICLAAFGYAVNDPQFYVIQPEVSGRRTVPLKELYVLTGAPGLHVFWIDPEAMRAALLASPSIAAAEVTVGWPNRLQLELVERAPVAVWQQAGAEQWVAADGTLMPARGRAPELLRIVAEGSRPLSAETAGLDPAIVEAGLALRALRPNIGQLRYFARGGLAYDDGRGWQAYFGTGAGMPEKLVVYETLVDYLLGERDLAPGEIEYIVVSDVRHPFYKIREGGARGG